MSILLKIESYCDNCDLFEPKTEKTALYSTVDCEVEVCNTIVTCTSRTRCKELYKRIKAEGGSDEG